MRGITVETMPAAAISINTLKKAARTKGLFADAAQAAEQMNGSLDVTLYNPSLHICSICGLHCLRLLFSTLFYRSPKNRRPRSSRRGAEAHSEVASFFSLSLRLIISENRFKYALNKSGNRNWRGQWTSDGDSDVKLKTLTLVSLEVFLKKTKKQSVKNRNPSMMSTADRCGGQRLLLLRLHLEAQMGGTGPL